MKRVLRLALIVLITVILTLIIILPVLTCEFPKGKAIIKDREILDHNEMSKVDGGENRQN